RRRVEPHLKILHTVSETVSRTLDVEEILKTALEALTHVTGHEIASVHLVATDGVTLELRAERGLSQQMREVNRALTVGEGIIGRVASSGATVVVRDVTPAVHERIALMADEASRAAGIVQNLLMFARHYPPERRPCSLVDAVQRVIALKSYQLEQDKVRVTTELDHSPTVWADENQMQQVLLNLVQNAHQAMARQEGERVLTVRLRPRDRHVAIEVLDSGPGIPASLLSRIFDPFFTTKPPGEGSGLGLSVSYGIVGQHGGR